MGLWSRIREGFSKISEKISSIVYKGEKKVDNKFVEKLVKHWNKQEFKQGKYGLLKPKPIDLRKIPENKFPSEKAYRPTLSKTDKNFLTVVKVKGFDRKTRKKKEFTMVLGHDKRLTPKKLSDMALEQRDHLVEGGDMPDEYDVEVYDVIPIMGYFNVNNFPDIIDKLNPKYFEKEEGG